MATTFAGLQPVERRLLAALERWSDDTGHAPPKEEQKCLASLARAPPYIVAGNLTVWGLLAYYTLDVTGARRVPRWLKLWGAAGIAAGAFGS
ncbi:hypothetical protein HK405_015582 [Cladochytrium tenue]|nr:hypothetical protein HK405_015582 [Cladochytrium tenue]